MTANLVAVTACPTGIAHSQMGAEGLERAAADAGHEIRVEVQGALGVEDDLSDADLDWADAAIVAADVRVDVDRFHAADLPVVEVAVSESVTDPASVVARAAALADDEGPTQPASTPATDGSGPEQESEAASGLLDWIRELL